jgi:transposase
MGYPGTDSNVVRLFGHLRKHFDQSGTFKQVDPATQTPVQVPPRRPPSASQVAHWVTFKEEQRLDWQKQYLTRLCEADQEIREACELITGFTTMLRERGGERLDAWLEKVETQGVIELKNFAQGVKRDYDAVKAGLTLQWSQGAVEGHVHRLKLLKRQAYGRASFQTLRRRVLRCS